MKPLQLVRSDRVRICGFCSTGHHPRCSIGVKQRTTVFVCTCTQGGCEKGRRKCFTCGNRNTDEVDPRTWECHDRDKCITTVEARREANPLNAELRTARRKAKMAEIEKKAEKAEKVAKEKPQTFCLVTGEPTKGGLFKPGMDARYASERVAEVMDGKQTLDQVIARSKKDGVSETLQAKITKGVRLAQEKKAKQEKAKKDREAAKAAEKAEKDAAKAESKTAEPANA